MRKLYCIILIITLTLPTFSSSILGDDNQSTSDIISSGNYKKGYRYNINGWIYLHIEGDPYERGYQHGYLLADEIVDMIQRWINIFPQKGSWKVHKIDALRLFWNKYPVEYKQEIKGIADGVAAKGGKIDGTSVNYKDILTLNEMYESLSRYRRMSVYPFKLGESWWAMKIYKLLTTGISASNEEHIGKCSAFLATGDSTTDGGIIAAHSTFGDIPKKENWWHNYISERWNVLLDIVPTNGHRMLISTSPGLIWSDEDYYQNDAGMILMETTLDPPGPWTRFGDPIVIRARKAIQYSDSIDEIVNCLLKKNNGLMANDWLIGDTKTGEIASLQLALRHHALTRTKNGVIWSTNDAKDDKVRWELNSFTGLGIIGRFWSKTYLPNQRGLKFEELLNEYYGKIDIDIAKKIMSTYPIHIFSTDCKITSSDLLDNFGLWAFMGKTDGSDFIESDYPFNDEKPGYTDLPGCGWVQIFGRDKSSIYRDFNKKSSDGNSGKIIWEFQSDKGEFGNAVYSSPVSDKEKIYFTSWNGNISALDINTGEKIWENNIGWSSESSPIVVNDKLIVGSSDGLFVLNNDNGEIIWSNEVGSISTKPLYYNNIVYCGSHDSKFYAFDLETGDIKWFFETNGEIYSSPVLKENVLYFGSYDGFLYALDVNDGDLKWKYKTDGPVVSTPVIFNDDLYFGSWDSNLYSLNSKKGSLNWKFTTGWGIDCSPAIHDKTVFFGSKDNSFYALNVERGTLKWVFQTFAGIKSSPYIYGGLVFFGSSDGYFYALDEKDGKLDWSIAPDYHIDGIYNYKTKPIDSSPFAYDGKVFVGSTNGKIYCLDAQTYEKTESIKKVIEVPIDAWLFLVLSLLSVILITGLYLFFDWRKNI